MSTRPDSASETPHRETTSRRAPADETSSSETNVGRKEETVVGNALHLVERGLLIVVAAMTIGAAAIEIWGIYETRTITLGDILLMFLYTEVIGMVAVFYSGRRSIFVYPIFIAMTALARLVILQGKDMAPENILFEAGAILLLALAAAILIRLQKIRLH